MAERSVKQKKAQSAKSNARAGEGRQGKEQSKRAKASRSKKTTGRTGSGAAMDRRTGCDRRKGPDRRTKNEPVAAERRTGHRREKVNRRRQIDPTTCERDYTPEEIEFMSALDDYKRASGRMFPTCSEVLEVVKSLGYEKRPQPSKASEGLASGTERASGETANAEAAA